MITNSRERKHKRKMEPIMKTKILKSPLYLRYLFSVIFAIILYIGSTGLMFAANGKFAFNKEDGFLYFLIALICLPYFLFYLVKLLNIRLNLKNYQEYQGQIVGIENFHLGRWNNRTIAIAAEGLDFDLHAKVFPGELNDQLEDKAKVEIAYNKKNGHAILLRVL